MNKCSIACARQRVNEFISTPHPLLRILAPQFAPKLNVFCLLFFDSVLCVGTECVEPNVWSEPERVDPKCGPKMWTQMWFESVRRFPVDPNLAATHPSLYLWGRIGSTHLGPIWVRIWVRAFGFVPASLTSLPWPPTDIMKLAPTGRGSNGGRKVLSLPCTGKK